MQIKFFKNIKSSKRVLIAGVGGGFDIASGIPLYRYLRDLGKEVLLANFSFTDLVATGSEMMSQGLYPITTECNDLPYFPEKLIIEWIKEESAESVSMYAFSNQLGVASLRRAYLEIIEKHNIDTLIMVDGGTDSLMFGDESGVGTIIEDSCSLLATLALPVEQSFLVATAFGVEQHHNLNHYSCLENIAELTKADAFQGCFSLTKEMKEGKYYLDMVAYLNKRQPNSMSIVANSIASAMEGEFGDYHPTPKTKGSEQFINPFMGLYWFFDLDAVASRIKFGDEIKETETIRQVIDVFKVYRASCVKRVERGLPL